jgi:PAS domain-containing protein
MIKIRTAAREKKDEKDRLERMVEERTRDLNAATLQATRLLEALRRENEIRIKSENALLEAQKLAHIGSFECDALRNRLSWTQEGLNIFGVDREEQLQTREIYYRFIHPEDRKYVLRQEKQAIRQKQTWNFVSGSSGRTGKNGIWRRASIRSMMKTEPISSPWEPYRTSRCAGVPNWRWRRASAG